MNVLMNEPGLLLITGGARSGKSRFALQLAREREAVIGGGVCFIATAEALDREMELRISKHRQERPAHWRTIEETRELDRAILQARDSRLIIVDCLTLFVSNWLMAVGEQRAGDEVSRVAENFLEIVKETEQQIICVSNEVGMGIVPDNSLSREFRDVLGRMNQRFAEAASQVYLLVAGLPIRIKPD